MSTRLGGPPEKQPEAWAILDAHLTRLLVVAWDCLKSCLMRPITPVLILFASTVTACTDSSPLGPADTRPPLPPLSDAIPYAALGSGKIAFSRVGPYPGEYHGFYVVDIDNRRSEAFNPYDVQPATRLGEPGYFIAFMGPSISPDGTQIAFRGGSWVFVTNTDGTEMECVSCDPAMQHLRPGWPGDAATHQRIPGWAPDGAKLYFWAGLGADMLLLAQSPVANPTDRQTLASIFISFMDGGYDSRVSVGPTGAMLFSGSIWDSDSTSFNGIHVLRQGDEEPQPLIVDTLIHTTEQPMDTFVWRASPVWSPDGTQIAYLAIVADSVAVMVASSDGTSSTSLLRQAVGRRQWAYGVIYNITWSPDGEKLLFNVPEGDFVSHLYLINVDGSGLQAVTTAPGVTDRSPSWSR